MLAIAQRELGALFRSPIAWVIAAVLQVFFAWYFLSTLEQYLAIQDKLALQDHAPGITAFLTFRYLAPCAALLLLICPLLGMRSYSDEYRHGTLLLLQTAPISATSIVLGKFLGLYVFIAFLLALAVVMPMSMMLFTQVDVATLALSLVGLLMVAGLCTAVAQLFSSLTRHAMVAAISSASVLLLLWTLGKSTFTGEKTRQVIETLATSTHLGSFFQGLARSGDLIYFAALTMLALGLTLIRVTGLGWTGSPGR